MADTREILLKLLGRETVSTAAKKAAAGLDDLGDAADDAARDTAGLDRELEQASRSAEELRREIARTGKLSLFKDLGRVERDVRRLSRLRDAFGDAGDDAALGFSARFSQRIGPLIASAPISPPLVAGVAAAAPLVASALSAAISGGAAAGAVGIGAALASKRTEVAKAFTELGGDITSALVVDAGVLAEPLIEASERARAEFRKIRPEIQGVFADAARYVEPLSRGLAGLGRELVPGLREAVREARPVVDVLEYKLPAAGKTTSNALKLITEDSENAAAALSTLLSTVEVSLTGTAGALGLLNKALPVTSTGVLLLNKLYTDHQKEAADAAAADERLARAQSRAAQAVGRTTAEIEAMNQALADAPGEALSAEQAMLAYEQATADANQTIKENGRATNENSQKYRDNRAALLGMAQATQAAAEAAGRQAGGQQRANDILDQGRARLIAAAKAAGYTAAAARKLADDVLGIPGARTTKFTVNKQQAERDIARINSQANYAARARAIRFYAAGAISGSLGAVGQRAEGGPIRKGQPYMVGEKGPELITAREDGFVHTAAATRKMMGSGSPVGGGQTITLRLIQQTPDGRVLREQLIDYAARTNVAPVNLWPTS